MPPSWFSVLLYHVLFGQMLIEFANCASNRAAEDVDRVVQFLKEILESSKCC